jgi:DNA sulfur modification protein DndD
LENSLKSEEERAKNLLSEMKTKTGKASLLLVSNTIDSVFEAIDQKKQKGEIPSEIRKDLIERILFEKKCVCGRELLMGTEPFKEIINWKNKVTDVELDNSALEVWRYLSSIKSNNADIPGIIQTLLKSYGDCSNNIENHRQKLEQIKNKIGSSERKDAASLENHRESIEKKQIKIEAERQRLEDELNTIYSDYKQLSEQRKLLELQENIKNELSLRLNLAESTHEALENIFHNFTEEIKKKITDVANEYFLMLLDKEGRETLRNIVVKEDYSLQIYDKWGKPFLANISAGQRQIMSIAFIAALAKVAAPDATLEMPLFMDTPFGRLSLEHRRNLLEKLPTIGAQLIMMVTDTEFRRQEASILRDSGRWGCFYSLQGEGPGITVIQDRDIDSAQSILFKSLEE